MRDRLHVWVGVAVAAALALVIAVMALRGAPTMPTEVWVPAASLGPAGDRGRLADLRLAPGGDEVTRWRVAWAVGASGEPLLWLREPRPLWQEVPLFTTTDCFRFHGDGFADSGERRDVAGAAWARLARFDEDEMRRRMFGD